MFKCSFTYYLQCQNNQKAKATQLSILTDQIIDLQFVLDEGSSLTY